MLVAARLDEFDEALIEATIKGFGHDDHVDVMRGPLGRAVLSKYKVTRRSADNDVTLRIAFEPSFEGL